MKIHVKRYLQYLLKKQSSNSKVKLILEGLLSEPDDSRKYFLNLKTLHDNDPKNAEVTSILALCYYYGIGTETDIKNALELCSSANQEKNGTAQFIRGICYHNGEGGLKRDDQKAKAFLELAAAQMDPFAQVTLGQMYSDGDGIEKNPQIAFRLLELSATQKIPQAQVGLGHCYYHGEGVEKDSKKAAECYALAAHQGNARGQVALSLCYAMGIGVETNPKRALELMESAANQGNESALLLLGNSFITGEYFGVVDLKKAKELIQIIANQGNPQGQYLFGFCFFEGYGVQKDLKQAIKYFEYSAKQNYVPSYYMLGKCYEAEKEKDLEKAAGYFILAANKGDKDSLEELRNLEKLGIDPSEIKPPRL